MDATTAVSSQAPQPGFFGKVKSHGDFVSRRLPTQFTSRWDQWLQLGMQRGQATLGSRWLAHYQACPIWRFAIGAAVCDGQSWAGILMASADRVGRQFPLTIAAGVAGDAPLLDWVVSAVEWYDALETCALSTRGEHFVLDDFDQILRNLPLSAERRAIASGARRLEIDGIDDLQSLMPALQQQIAEASLREYTLWWTEGSQYVAPSLLVCLGLPSASQFMAMLSGQWDIGGWR